MDLFLHTASLLTQACIQPVQYPHAMGIGRHNILRHLREHVLTPNVRMASIIRSLITLAETLRCTLHQIDSETGEAMVDVKNTELYLKVISQIHNVYKTDGSRMLFGISTAVAQQTSSATVNGPVAAAPVNGR